MRKIPQGAGLYLAALELVFALGWTVYAIYLPRLAASAGIAAGTVIYILMLDQAIFTVTDFATRFHVWSAGSAIGWRRSRR